MFLTRLHQLFWDIYGSSAWDSVQLPINRKMIKSVVLTLKEQMTHDGETVLDAGCGTGNYAVALAENGFCVTGIDYSSGMLESAHSKITPALSDHLSFQKQDMNDRLSFPDSSFDHVISMTSLWTVADPRFTLGELTRVVRPGGTIVVLQVPKPTKSLYAAVHVRIKHLHKKSFGLICLVIIKAILERTDATRYWNSEELLALLLSNKDLKMSYVDHGPPIIIVAKKTHESIVIKREV